MTRGTTPTLTLSIDNADLSTLKNMYITFSQETRKLIKVYQAGSENNQIEIDDTDAKILGVIPPRRQSGDLNDSLPITVIGPKGSVFLDKGLIMSDAHIHMDPETATKMHLVNKEVVDVFKNGVKLLNVKIKILDNSYIEMHIDKDEGVLYDLHQGDIVEFKKTL